MLKSSLLRIVAVLLVCSFAILAADDQSTYIQSVEKWRQAYQATLTSDTGWLTVSGLFWLNDGENRFGSAPGNDIQLPASAPPSAGSFLFKDGQTTLQLNPGVAATMNGHSVTNAILRPDNPQDYVFLGDLTVWVHRSGDRYAIRLRDKNSALRKNFTGLHWFPVDPAYHVSATYSPYPQPRSLDAVNVLGDAIQLVIVGELQFSLNGQPYRLEAGSEHPGTLFVVFRDLTAGKETYPASRFLTLDLPAAGAGAVDLDFNKAYNPPCAYNPFTTCPIPLPGNRLKIAIPAGEKLYKKHD